MCGKPRKGFLHNSNLALPVRGQAKPPAADHAAGGFRTFQIGGKSHAAGRKSVCDCPRRDVSERNHCRRQWLLARRETQEGFPAQFKSGFACPRTGEAPGCGSRGRGHIIASKTVSRVLYLTVIYLDAPLPVRSSHPGSGPGKPRGSNPQLPFRCCSG